jgi:hypothetical protein
MNKTIIKPTLSHEQIERLQRADDNEATEFVRNFPIYEPLGYYLYEANDRNWKVFDEIRFYKRNSQEEIGLIGMVRLEVCGCVEKPQGQDRCGGYQSQVLISTKERTLEEFADISDIGWQYGSRDERGWYKWEDTQTNAIYVWMRENPSEVQIDREVRYGGRASSRGNYFGDKSTENIGVPTGAEEIANYIKERTGLKDIR